MSKKDRLYTTWSRIRQQCNSRTHPSFNHYGGRGIIICEEWDEFSVFCDWAIKNGWDSTATNCYIGRYDPDDDFYPDNCFVYKKNPR